MEEADISRVARKRAGVKGRHPAKGRGGRLVALFPCTISMRYVLFNRHTCKLGHRDKAMCKA